MQAPIRCLPIIVTILLLAARAPGAAAGDAGAAEPIEELTAFLPGGATMEFVWIEPGTFWMGTTREQEQRLRSQGNWDEWYGNEQPARQVTISRGFYLGRYEITQKQWESATGTRPWLVQQYVQPEEDRPAVSISWEDVQVFIQRLNQAADEELYRLPTEAEWEYACRAGTGSLWHFGDDESRLGEVAWYRDNAWDAGRQYGQTVGLKEPNPWGLYDMHGNVWEWCQDWFAADYYQSAPDADPPGPADGSIRVVRGGGFYCFPLITRSAFRNGFSPDFRDGHLSARLVRVK